MKINIRFFIDKTKSNKMDKCPLNCRITYNKQRKQFSSGVFINPKNWNSKHQEAEPPDKENTLINQQLSLIENRIRQAFLLLQVQQNNFTVNDIYSAYKGEKLAKEYGTVEFFEVYLNKLEKLVGIDLKQSTYDKFCYVKNNVKAFVKWKFKSNDLPLKKLKEQFLVDYDYYMKVEKGKKQVTINKEIQRFRKPIKIAVAEGYLDKDPFMLYRAKHVKKEVVFLSTEELQKLEEYQFKQLRLQEVKDWFIFSCYTGLAYNELSRLEKKHIVKGYDGELWIEMKREKTQKNISVPLLLKAKRLIDMYLSDNSENIFNVSSNQKYNSYLKEIAEIVGIEKNLTTHTARKTFASTVLLYNDVSMEIVSEILGHSSISITEDSYGKVVKKKVGLAIKKIQNI